MGATIIESARELKIRLPNEKEIYSNVTFSIGSTIWNGEPNMTTLMLFNQVYSALKRLKVKVKIDTFYLILKIIVFTIN